MFKLFIDNKEKKTEKGIHGISFDHRELEISVITGYQFNGSWFNEAVIFPPDGYSFPLEGRLQSQFRTIGEAVAFADKIADAIELGTIQLIEKP